ncbi:hypothetical protein AV903_03465 [Erwinia tracheiphila]|uniref:Uncharacterized protein n=1 Tax=Erwinia tracheiphila TaxID=65700 RepID=A0A345CPK8_9GAMM|nr:hypothetical protein AV903_03465 [Erwinia tracheiphila]
MHVKAEKTASTLEHSWTINSGVLFRPAIYCEIERIHRLLYAQKQSSNQAIKQSSNQAIKQSSLKA